MSSLPDRPQPCPVAEEAQIDRCFLWRMRGLSAENALPGQQGNRQADEAYQSRKTQAGSERGRDTHRPGPFEPAGSERDQSHQAHGQRDQRDDQAASPSKLECIHRSTVPGQRVNMRPVTPGTGAAVYSEERKRRTHARPPAFCSGP